jgi:hypothetical protein
MLGLPSVFIENNCLFQLFLWFGFSCDRTLIQSLERLRANDATCCIAPSATGLPETHQTVAMNKRSFCSFCSFSHPLTFNSFRRSLATATLVIGVGLTGCAVELAQPGMTQQEVLSRYGTPTRTVALPQGGTRLQYSRQPAGQSVVMVDLDASGRVLRSQEVMTLQAFSRIVPGQWTRADVEREFGPPGAIGRVGNFAGDVLTYRWRDQVDKFFWIFVNAAGVVEKTQQGVEFINVPPEN